MEHLGSYLLQMACWLAGFWLVYALVLRKETFFVLNRWFLLSGLILSIVLPFFPLKYRVVLAVPQVPLSLSIGQSAAEIAYHGVSAVNWFVVIYLFGVFCCMVRFMRQNMKLNNLRNVSEKVAIGPVQMVRLETDSAPFSYFNTIYVSKKMCGEVELKAVVAHEKVHIEERHWVDLLLLEVTRALQWFNPLLIYYRKAVMQNHEYLADLGTLKNGVSARTYKAVLANQMLGVPVVRFANCFTLFNPTKRILMMNKNKTKPVKRLKLLWVLPVVVLILTAFAKPNYVSGESANNKNQKDDGTKNITGRIFDQFGKPVPNAFIYTTNNQNISTSDRNGKFLIAGENGVDDVSISKEGFSVVNKIIKSESELVFLTMKDNLDSDSEKTITIKGQVTNEKGEPLHGASVIIAHTNNGAISDVKGAFTLSGVKPDDDIVVSFVGYESVVSRAKSKMTFNMKRSIVAIDLKQENVAPPPPPPPPPPPASALEFRGAGGETPLIVIDGKISTIDINAIDPETIETISVMKGEAAIVLFGDKAKDGAVIITTKKEAAKNKSEEVFVVVEDMPSFPGGVAALNQYIAGKTTGVKGKGNVQVKFTVEVDGSISDVKILQSSNDHLNQQSIALIQEMPKWKPGKQRGKPVKVECTIPLDFK